MLWLWYPCKCWLIVETRGMRKLEGTHGRLATLLKDLSSASGAPTVLPARLNDQMAVDCFTNVGGSSLAEIATRWFLPVPCFCRDNVTSTPSHAE